jgi:hypothetical protein
MWVPLAEGKTKICAERNRGEAFAPAKVIGRMAVKLYCNGGGANERVSQNPMML